LGKLTYLSDLKIIGFDADDTLWINEPYYRESEKEFFILLNNYISENEAFKVLYKTEMQNLERYGYGIKSFTLSMIETALQVSNGNVSPQVISRIIELGKAMIAKPVVLLDGVKEVLTRLNGKYRLIIATKGDLLDQERKLQESGLAHHFHHIEIMSEKKMDNYKALLKHLDINPNEFLMIGNSLKSDVLPVVAIGGQAIHVPFHTTWIYENVEKEEAESDKYLELKNLVEVIGILC